MNEQRDSGTAAAAQGRHRPSVLSRRLCMTLLVLAWMLPVVHLVPAHEASAQVVTGVVLDSETEEPVSDASVMLETWDGTLIAEARTGENGRFRIQVDHARSYVISAAAREFSRSELQLVELEEGVEVEVTIEVAPRGRIEPRLALDPVQAGDGEIAGRVVDAATGAPVPGAEVVLVARTDEERLATASSGPGGAFRLRPSEPGRYRIYARVGDFARTRTLLVDVPPGSGLSLTLELISDPVQLEEIVAEGRQEIFWWQTQRHPDVWDYYERRYFYQRLGLGRFYDGQYLQNWGDSSADEFMRAHASPSSRCSALTVYLNGLFVGTYRTGSTLSLEHRMENSDVMGRIGVYVAEELEGVEVYREGAFNPPDLVGCQIVGIWTRR
jgi:5-hydroxyisourate hydrolase-like protein (transthyretin family)